MKLSYIKIAIIIIISFLMVSCDKNEADYLAITAYEGVDERLWPFFQQFELAAEERGVAINLRTLKVEGSIQIIAADQIVGLCNHGSANEKHIIIDDAFWARASEDAKEAIIFHELGHCVLKRGHSDDARHDGMCKSLMRSGFSACLTMYRDGDNRDYYLDELFSE